MGRALGRWPGPSRPPAQMRRCVQSRLRFLFFALPGLLCRFGVSSRKKTTLAIYGRTPYGIAIYPILPHPAIELLLWPCFWTGGNNTHRSITPVSDVQHGLSAGRPSREQDEMKTREQVRRTASGTSNGCTPYLHIFLQGA